MSKAGKFLKRIQSKPKDFTWGELTTLLAGFGFELVKGNGSSRKFIHPATKVVLMMHEPHPGNILKAYQVRAALDLLRAEGHIQ
jgi:predicted RNA binding protein YcfA (HicA-like mRNA interferase family)